jgi:hypothetical protein
MQVQQKHPLETLYNTNIAVEMKRSNGGQYVEAMAIAYTHTNYLPHHADDPIFLFNQMDLMLNPREDLKRKMRHMVFKTPIFVLRHARELLLAAKLMKRSDVKAAFTILTDAYMFNFDLDVDTAQSFVQEDSDQMDMLLASTLGMILRN